MRLEEGAEQQSKIMYFLLVGGMQCRINSDLETRWYLKECHQERGNTEDYDGEIYKKKVNAEGKYFFFC